MNWFIVKNDLKRNRMINLVLLMFMMFSATLAVLSVLTAVQTFTSISELYKKAQPPHFLQMHKGEIEQEVIDEFMANYQSITHWQTSPTLVVYGEWLTIKSKDTIFDLSDLRLDIALTKQNETKDLLLNGKHEIVNLKEGEMGIPVLLTEMYDMEVGDKVILTTDTVNKEFVIETIILDSMMNSTMTSSTRILLNHKDYNDLEGLVGETEYLIEAYFNDTKESSDFQTAYENAKMPQNGQAITYGMIVILSAITDLVTVFVMMIVSVLLIVVSFICLKFTIMATLEEEISEIGTMKAIGLPFADIRNLYLIKYRLLAFIGVTTGYVLALFLSGLFTKRMNTMFGIVAMSPFTILLSILVSGLVFMIINYYCGYILKRIKKLTVVDALVTGKGFDTNQGGIKDGLHRSKKLSVNYLMALREVFFKFKNWVVVFLVVLIAVVMILIPVNLLNTFEDPKFVTYMGSSLEDVLIEIDAGENLEHSYQEVKDILNSDDSVLNYYEYRRVVIQTMDADQEKMNLHVDSGDGAGSGLQYLSGQAPSTINTIAISFLNAEKIGKEVGDKIPIFLNGLEMELMISGIYQDVTSGGFTAKSNYNFDELAPIKYTFSVNLDKGTAIEEKTAQWSRAIGNGVTVDPMKAFLNQTLGGVVKQLRIIVLAIVIIGACLVMLIVVLFLKLRLAKDLPEIAVLKAIGFSEKDIKKQYLIKIGCVSLSSILAGIVLTDILGEKIVNGSLNIAGIGVKQVGLISNPLIMYILCPLVLMVLILVVTRFVLRIIKKYNIIGIINE